MSDCFVVECVSKDSLARSGELVTGHGRVSTPFFMPVATKGAVKFVSHKELEGMGVECVISNAFINYLKPGLSLIESAGGLHKFMGWEDSLFTDSGGFQLILDHFVHKITDKGVFFRNPFDASIELVSPTKATLIQCALGSDVAMCLDHQPLFGKERVDYLDSAIRTIEWASECKKAFDSTLTKTNSKQLLFGIAQGGVHKDIRRKCALALTKMGFDSVALGGFGIGEAQKELYSVVKEVKGVLPENNLTYVMGIGSPLELLNLVSLGADAFDSTYPTRMARHGLIFTSNGQIKISNSVHKNSFTPLDSSCECFVCKNHSRAYLHHLFKTREQNGLMLLSFHNTFFVNNLLKGIRLSIRENRFNEFKKEFEKKYSTKKK